MDASRPLPLDLPGGDDVLITDVSSLLAEVAESVEQPDLGPTLVQAGSVVGQRLLERSQHRQFLVLDLDRADRRLRRRLVDRSDGSHGLADEPDPVQRDDRADP